MISINYFVVKKGVYPYEHIFLLMSTYPYDDWEKYNEITLPKKEEFYSSLNMEDITDTDSMHPKRVFKDFEIKNLG